MPFHSFEYEGIGESTPEYRHVRFQDWVEDVSTVLKTLTSGMLILVASSMGSWVSSHQLAVFTCDTRISHFRQFYTMENEKA